MATISKSDLSANLLEYFRRVEEQGEELIITDNQVPVLRITPLSPRLSPAEVFADVRGKVKYHADILEPTEDEWGEI